MNQRLTVTGIERHGDTCISFEMDAPFEWEAGQFVRIVQPGAELERCYSISRVSKPLRVAVKRVAGGKVSNWLNDNLRVGDVLSVSPPSGRFTLRDGSGPVVLIAGGSGITPVLSLAERALSLHRDVYLFYASRTPEEEIYRADIDALAQSPRCHLRRHYDSEHGLPVRDCFTAYSELQADVYICGPAPLIALGEAAFGASSRVFVERFSSSGVAPVAVPAPEAAPETFSLWLHGRCRTVPYTKGRTLLECAQDAGLKPRSSCESGFCGSCLSRVRAGSVLMRTSDALTDADEAQGLALLCQSVPTDGSPLEVDADNTSFRLSQRQGYSPQTARVALMISVALMILGTMILRLT